MFKNQLLSDLVSGLAMILDNLVEDPRFSQTHLTGMEVEHAWVAGNLAWRTSAPVGEFTKKKCYLNGIWKGFSVISDIKLLMLV